MATNFPERQNRQSAVVVLGVANIGAGNEVTVDIPAGGLLQAVNSLTTTAFDSTTITLTATDGTTSFITAADVKATGADAGTGVPKYFPAGGTVTISLAQTGTGTVGQAIVELSYLQVGKADLLYRN